MFLLSSSDDGKTWTTPKEITVDVKKPDWTWYATGPVHGIQLEEEPYRGRLIIPCDHIEAETEDYYSHIIFSDDHGVTWQLGGRTPQDQVNECTVAELSNGTLMLNMRNYDRNFRTRKISLSEDGGMTWSDIHADSTLVEPICQASMLNYVFENAEQKVLLFLNPAHREKRINMTLRISEDEGKSWDRAIQLWAGPVAYSDMVQLTDGNLGCLF